MEDPCHDSQGYEEHAPIMPMPHYGELPDPAGVHDVAPIRRKIPVLLKRRSPPRAARKICLTPGGPAVGLYKGFKSAQQI